MSQTTFEVTERGFDFLCPKIKRYSTLQVSIVEERNVPIIKKDLWGINETIAFKKYFMVNLTGLNDLDEKTKQRIQLYIDGSQGEEWNDDQDELNQKHIKTETLLKYVVLAYIAQGKFVANNKSDLDNQPTIDTAICSLLDIHNKTWVHAKLKLNVELRQDAEILFAKITHWLKKMDFVEFSKFSPDWMDYFIRLHEVSHSQMIDIKNAKYVAGLLQTFLRFEKEKTKEEKGIGYVGVIGQSMMFRGKVIVSKSLFGCKKFEAHLYMFQDLSGNLIKWVTNKKDGIKLGVVHNVSGKVKSHQVDTFIKQPTTVITHAKFEQT